MSDTPTKSSSETSSDEAACELPVPVALATSPSGSAHIDFEPGAAKQSPSAGSSSSSILRQLVLLAAPVMAETLLHTVVGLNDTYLANHLPPDPAASTAAVGTVMYFFWFIGLFSGAIGTGATALIARATGAKEPERATTLCAQALLIAGVMGVLLGAAFFMLADVLVYATGLPGAGSTLGASPIPGTSAALAASYFRYLSWGVPFVVILAVANAALRGSGDTVRPAIAMIVVGICTITLTNVFIQGMFGLPKLGFVGLAIGTAIPYALGAGLQLALLFSHRLRLRPTPAMLVPHPVELSRLLKIGLPAGAENLLMWSANFVLLRIINQLDNTAASAAAHANAIRLEALSFMTGFAVSVAAASLVGQKLGAGDVQGARRVAHMAWCLGGGIMCAMGLSFLALPGAYANFLSEDPRVISLTTQCLFIAGFCQLGFSAAIVYGGALRGAGDTFVVMVMTLASILLLRVCGVLIVTQVFGGGLSAVWWVLAADLTMRGTLAYWRFSTGRWAKIKI